MKDQNTSVEAGKEHGASPSVEMETHSTLSASPPSLTSIEQLARDLVWSPDSWDAYLIAGYYKFQKTEARDEGDKLGAKG